MLESLFGLSLREFLDFVLVFVRILAWLLVAPVFGSRVIPTQVKVLLSLFCSVTLLPIVKSDGSVADWSYSSLLFAGGQEMLVGLFLGFSTRLIFEGFQFAGRLIGNQMGLGMAELVDPENGAQASPIGNFLMMVGMVLFLQLDGHHVLIGAVHDSFRILPLHSGGGISRLASEKFLRMFGQIFQIAIRLAAPAMVTFFILELCLGIMARIAPQMNIFFIGLPVRLALGLLVLMIALPVFYLLLSTAFSAWGHDIRQLLLIYRG